MSEADEKVADENSEAETPEEAEAAPTEAEEAPEEGDDDDTEEGDDDDTEEGDDDDAEEGDDDDAEEGDDDAAEEGDDDDAEEGDDDDAEEGDDAPSAAAKKPSGKKAGKKGRDGMTPGERLAAAKARKAKRKSDKRGRQAEVVEDQVLKKAEVATNWVAENRSVLWAAVGAVVLVIAGATYWSMSASARSAEASAALWDAVSAARGEIRSEGNIAGGQDDSAEVFDSAEARSEAALERALKVRSDFPNTNAAAWAALSAGTAMLELRRWVDAREMFSAALTEGGANSMVTYRALEGIAFSYEGDQQWAEATARFNELKNSDGPFAEIATYHLARMHLAEGDTERAKELLVELLDTLREERDDLPALNFVRSQAEIRLLELDSSLVDQGSSGGGFDLGGGITVPGGGGGGGAGQQEIPPEIMEQLRQQLQENAGGAGGE